MHCTTIGRISNLSIITIHITNNAAYIAYIKYLFLINIFIITNRLLCKACIICSACTGSGNVAAIINSSVNFRVTG